MPSERVTVAIPFHSGIEYLKEAVASVLGQTDPDWQLLVVDDGGREQGVEIWVASLRDARVTYLRNPRNLGMVRCWNRCLEAAGNDLVCLLHADDRWLPEYLARVKRLAADHPGAVALFTGAVVIGAEGRPRRSFQDDIKRVFVPDAKGDLVLDGEAALRAVMRGNFLVCPSLCWRKRVLGERRFDPAWHQVQDLELVSRLLLAGETLAGSMAPAYAYRRHDASATARHTESLLRFEEEFALFDRVADGARERGWRGAERTARSKVILRLHLLWRVWIDLLRLRWGTAGRSLRFLLAPRPRS